MLQWYNYRGTCYRGTSIEVHLTLVQVQRYMLQWYPYYRGTCYSDLHTEVNVTVVHVTVVHVTVIHVTMVQVHRGTSKEVHVTMVQIQRYMLQVQVQDLWNSPYYCNTPRVGIPQLSKNVKMKYNNKLN